jgi:hypothetical protein
MLRGKVFWAALFLTISLWLGKSTQAGNQQPQYLPETGHWLAEGPVTQHQSNLLATTLYGPITNAFPDNNAVLSLLVQASPAKAVTGTDGTQTLFVVVQDQNLRPVPNAQVTFTLRSPSGAEAVYLMPPTNEHGITHLMFSLNGLPFGLVEVLVTASYSNLEKQTATSFRIWW